MEDSQLLVDLHRKNPRQGPGGHAETDLALALARIDWDTVEPLKVADIGCGTGASAISLANSLNATITAVDIFQEFLDDLVIRAEVEDVRDRITTLQCSMDSLPFAAEELDIIWAEGSIYNIGFSKGVSEWRPFLKVGGLLVVSEITWLTESRPPEIDDHWKGQYPEIDVASAKIRVLENHGYSPIGYFTLPEHCWMEHYYRPLEDRFENFLARNGNSEQAQAIVDAEISEIELYQKYKNYFSYGVYIARKL